MCYKLEKEGMIKDLLLRDRQDISNIIERINSTLRWFVIASFGITAFFIEKEYSFCVLFLAEFGFFIISVAYAAGMYREILFIRNRIKDKSDYLFNKFGDISFYRCIDTDIQDYGIIKIILILGLIFGAKSFMLIILNWESINKSLKIIC